MANPHRERSEKGEAVWGQFLKVVKPDSDRLEGLVGDTKTYYYYKKRAVESLLDPNLRWLPGWSVSFYDFSKIRTNVERGGQVEFAADVLLERLPEVKDDKLLEKYNSMMTVLLPISAADRAEQLFDRFEINDIYAWQHGGRDHSGYNPLADLVNDPEIPDVWKSLAFKRLQQRVVDEESERVRPRVFHERALPNYRRMMEVLFEGMYHHTFRKEVPLGRGCFQEQIEFLMTQPMAEWGDIGHKHIVGAMRLLAEPTRHAFARRQFVENPYRKVLIVFDEQIEQFKWVRSLYPHDQELQQVLSTEVEIREKEKQKYAERHMEDSVQRTLEDTDAAMIYRAMQQPLGDVSDNSC